MGKSEIMLTAVFPKFTEFQRLNPLRLQKTDYRLDMAEQGLLNSLYGKENIIQYFPFAYNGNLAAFVQNQEFWLK